MVQFVPNYLAQNTTNAITPHNEGTDKHSDIIK